MAVKIFFCYAHEDEQLLNNLKAHLRPLQRQGLIDVWYDRDISAGTEWEQEINKRLNESQMILLLVSPDFMNSDYCYGTEMKRAIERHQRGEAKVIPIILRPVYWQGVLGMLQALPTDAIPITDRYWQTLDEAFFDVTRGISRAVEQLTTMNSIILPSSPVKVLKPEQPLFPGETTSNEEIGGVRESRLYQVFRRPSTQEGVLTKPSIWTFSTILFVVVLVVAIGMAVVYELDHALISTSPSPNTSTAGLTKTPNSIPPTYVSGLSSTNPSIFLNSFSQALQYLDIQNIEDNTDTLHFTVSCDPSIIIVTPTAEQCDLNWKKVKNLLSKDELEFDFQQYAQQNPALTGTCGNIVEKENFYVLGSVDNKGFHLPISHFATAVFTFTCVSCGSESTWAWKSVYIC